MTAYYDLVLGVIPVALVGITGSLSLAGISLTTAVPLASAVAIAVMCHALFVNAPGQGSPATSTPAPTPEPTTAASGAVAPADD